MTVEIGTPDFAGMVVAIGRGELHHDEEDLALRLVARILGWPEDEVGIARLNQLCIDAADDPLLQATLEANAAEWRVTHLDPET